MYAHTLRVGESRLFSYEIGSGDMWYSAVCGRTLYLRNEPHMGPIMRGEICDMGPQYHANLSQVLLEYAVSCEGCHDLMQASRLVQCVGERLGRILAGKLNQATPDLPVIEQVSDAFDIILRSMGSPAQMHESDKCVRYELGCPPLLITAKRTGLWRGLLPARQSFMALCASTLNTLAPEWRMGRPVPSEAELPLTEIVLYC